MSINLNEFGMANVATDPATAARVTALETRMTNAERNIADITEEGVSPVQGNFSCGDWDEWAFITFAAWTAN